VQKHNGLNDRHGVCGTHTRGSKLSVSVALKSNIEGITMSGRAPSGAADNKLSELCFGAHGITWLHLTVKASAKVMINIKPTSWQNTIATASLFIMVVTVEGRLKVEGEGLARLDLPNDSKNIRESSKGGC
jgi:hypothetical protein